MTRQEALEPSPLVAARFPLVPEALALLGHPAIRNRGTIGGSVAHTDPAAELAAPGGGRRADAAGAHDGLEASPW